MGPDYYGELFKMRFVQKAVGPRIESLRADIGIT
jgi:hypothetical protein